MTTMDLHRIFFMHALLAILSSDDGGIAKKGFQGLITEEEWKLYEWKSYFVQRKDTREECHLPFYMNA